MDLARVAAPQTGGPVEIGTCFQVGRMRYRLTRDAGGIPTLASIPRSQWVELAGMAEPNPASAAYMGDDGKGGASFSYTWRAGEARRCSRCDTCTAGRQTPDSPVTCMPSGIPLIPIGPPTKPAALLDDDDAESANN